MKDTKKTESVDDSKRVENPDNCFDCGKEFEDNSVLHVYHTKDKDIYKCGDCFKIDPILKNFQKCEVYSRVVGYMRPVEAWNVGKKEEYKDRKEFKV